jgi:hypothetical protein
MLFDRDDPSTHTVTQQVTFQDDGDPVSIDVTFEAVDRTYENAVILVDAELETLREEGPDHDSAGELLLLGNTLAGIYDYEPFDPTHDGVARLFDDYDENSRDDAFYEATHPEPLGTLADDPQKATQS